MRITGNVKDSGYTLESLRWEDGALQCSPIVELALQDKRLSQPSGWGAIPSASDWENVVGRADAIYELLTSTFPKSYFSRDWDPNAPSSKGASLIIN